MFLLVAVCGRTACLTLKRGEGESRASHQVSADNQRSCAFDLGGFFFISDLERPGAAPAAKFGVDMDIFSWRCNRPGWLWGVSYPKCDGGNVPCAGPVSTSKRESWG